MLRWVCMSTACTTVCDYGKTWCPLFCPGIVLLGWGYIQKRIHRKLHDKVPRLWSFSMCQIEVVDVHYEGKTHILNINCSDLGLWSYGGPEKNGRENTWDAVFSALLLVEFFHPTKSVDFEISILQNCWMLHDQCCSTFRKIMKILENEQEKPVVWVV